MLNDERGANYLRQGRKFDDSGNVLQERGRTPRQMRRLNQKGNSRKTHQHDRSLLGPEENFRCPRCSPYPWRTSTDIRPASGPRDWKTPTE